PRPDESSPSSLSRLEGGGRRARTVSGTLPAGAVPSQLRCRRPGTRHGPVSGARLTTRGTSMLAVMVLARHASRDEGSKGDTPVAFERTDTTRLAGVSPTNRAALGAIEASSVHEH